MRRFSLVPVTLAAALAAASPLHAQQDTALVEAVFRLDIENGPSDVLLAAAVDTRLLLPLRRFLDLVEVGTADAVPGRWLEAVLQPANDTIRFDTDNMQLTVGDSVYPLGRFDAVWRDGDLFVYTGTLMQAFGVEVGVDWIALIAVVGHTDGLPVARRGRRERRRAIIMRRAPAFYEAVTAPARDRLADGAVLQWSLSGATESPFGTSSAEIGLGAELLGGGLAIEYERHAFPGGSVTRAEASWQRAWPEHRWVRQVRIGDVPTGGRRSRTIRGAVVTNQPFIRSSEFDFEEIVGEIPPGWEVELYDAYGLLDFGEADPFGEFRVAMPLRYGQNPFDMVMYGPRGEVVRRRRTIRVPFSRLPAGAFEYAAGLGACRSDEPCGGVFTADARYAFSSHVTGQAGWDLITRGGDSDVFQPYVAVSAAVLPSVRLTTEAVLNGQLRGEAEFEPRPDIRVQLAQTFLDGDGALFTSSPLDRRRTDASFQWLRYGRIATILQLTARRASGTASTRAFYGITGTARYAGGRYAVSLQHLRATQPLAPSLVRTSVDLNGDLVLHAGPRWLRPATVGGGLGFDFQRGFATIRAAIGRAVGRHVRMDFGIGWFRDQGGFAIELGLSTTMPGPRFGSRNRITSDAGTQGVQFVDGSLLWDRTAGRVQLGDGRDLGRAGVAGTVFLDVDGNGSRDADEPGIADVPVRVDGWTLDTDSTGRFSTWELFPFETALIVVDTSGFANPFYVMANRVVEITPTPNSYVPVDIPVMVGAEVSGGVLYNGRPLAGVRVELREMTTGQIIALNTFTDGGFYFIGVPPGEWEASVPLKVLEGIGARSAPVRFSVPAGAEEKRVEALVLTVENGNGG